MRQEVIDYINWLAGPVNPFTHPDLFSRPANDFEMFIYYEEKLKYLISEYDDETLISILIDIITNPPDDMDDGFDIRFDKLLKLYASSISPIYRKLFMDTLSPRIDTTSSRILLIPALGEFSDTHTVDHFRRMLAKGLIEEELILLIDTLGEMRGSQSFELLKFIKTADNICGSEAVRLELEIVMSWFDEEGNYRYAS